MFYNEVQEEYEMLKFIEPFIEKKIQLAEYLYINRGEVDTEFLVNELNLSNSTLKRYTEEINELYKEYYYNGTYYNVYALSKIIRVFLNQSSKLALFKQIAFYPGNSAEYYKQTLLLSDATFARLISQIKKELKPFNMSVVISSGYWIEGDNEKEIVFLFAYLTSTFKTDKDEIKAIIQQLGGTVALEEMGDIDYSIFKFSNYPFEHELFENIHLFALIRQFQCQKRGTGHQNESITPEKMIRFLEHTFEENEEKNRERVNHIVNTLFHDKIPQDRREVLIELLVKTQFHLTLFPYEMQMLDFRQDFFVRKMYYAHPHRKEVVNSFLLRLECLLKVELSKRMTSIIYFLVSENILVFEKQEYFQLYIYSTLGEQHIKFLTDQVTPLRQFFDDRFIIREWQDERILSDDENIILLTNQVFPDYPTDKQYIISDYLTLNEFLAFSKWLKERTVTKINYD